jgi:hypothetical protein
MYPTVISVNPLENYQLRLTFSTHEEKIFDLSPYLSVGRFKELTDINQFKRVSVKFDSIEWENGLDLDPEFLYNLSV